MTRLDVTLLGLLIAALPRPGLAKDLSSPVEIVETARFPGEAGASRFKFQSSAGLNWTCQYSRRCQRPVDAVLVPVGYELCRMEAAARTAEIGPDDTLEVTMDNPSFRTFSYASSLGPNGHIALTMVISVRATGGRDATCMPLGHVVTCQKGTCRSFSEKGPAD
jgi:hypothetical protein